MRKITPLQAATEGSVKPKSVRRISAGRSLALNGNAPDGRSRGGSPIENAEAAPEVGCRFG